MESKHRKQESQSQKFNISLNSMECPICMEIFQPPIFLCKTGHSICNQCKKKVTNCPTCQEPIMSTRNFDLERIVNKSVMANCKFCMKTFKKSELDAHEKSLCNYRPIECPHRISDGCHKNLVNLKELAKHLRKSHQYTIYSSPFTLKSSLRWVKTLEVKKILIKRLIKVKEDFHLTVHFITEDGLFYIFLKCLEECDEKILGNIVGSLSLSRRNDENENEVKIPCKVYRMRDSFEDLKPKLFSMKIASLEHVLDLEPPNNFKLLINIHERTTIPPASV